MKSAQSIIKILMKSGFSLDLTSSDLITSRHNSKMTMCIHSRALPPPPPFTDFKWPTSNGRFHRAQAISDRRLVNSETRSGSNPLRQAVLMHWITFKEV